VKHDGAHTLPTAKKLREAGPSPCAWCLHKIESKEPQVYVGGPFKFHKDCYGEWQARQRDHQEAEQRAGRHTRPDDENLLCQGCGAWVSHYYYFIPQTKKGICEACADKAGQGPVSVRKLLWK
jgi:hypothetical protein